MLTERQWCLDHGGAIRTGMSYPLRVVTKEQQEAANEAVIRGLLGLGLGVLQSVKQHQRHAPAEVKVGQKSSKVIPSKPSKPDDPPPEKVEPVAPAPRQPVGSE